MGKPGFVVMRNIIVVLWKGDPVACFGSLTEICRVYKLPYNYLKKKKFPFDYGDYTFHRFEFRKPNF